MKLIPLATLAAASAMTGCLTVAELHATPPVRVGTVAGRALPLARCVLTNVAKEHARDGVHYHLLEEPARRSARVVGQVRVPAGLFYTVPASAVELTFKEGDERTVEIEARRGFPDLALEPSAWGAVRACAGSTVTLVPPLP